MPPEEFPLCDVPKYHAGVMPNTVAVRCGGDELTWAELHRASNRVAHGLRRCGVSIGRIVTLALPGGVDMIVSAFACYKVGAIPQPLSTTLTERERDEILALAEPAAVVVDTERSGVPGATTVDRLRELGATDEDLPTVVAPSWKAPTSGGSTGRPKIILSGKPATYRAFDAEVWGIRPEDRLLVPAPLHHNAPFGTAMAGLFTGATVTLMRKFDPAGTLEEVSRHAISWLYLVPTMMRRIHALPDDVKQRCDLSGLRSVWHVAEPCPPWLKRAWIDWLGADVIWELYGGTEAQAGCTVNGREWLAHPGTVGRTTWGEIKIVDVDGAEVTTPRTPGEIYLRPAPESPEPYRYIGAEAKELDGWESLGDVGEFDEDGYLYLHDRLSDMIIAGGVNIYPAEVENALVEHPAVLSSAVIGLPDPDTGNRVHAIVETPDGDAVSAAEIAAHAGARLAPHKRPKSIEIVHEPLRDDTGKMRRSALRAERLTS
ncbi:MULTISPECIES: AMP-binding protein [Prauserella salsuginis group]|uniref:AMP-binding protein n=1 Tax=Prauserella salsuginis TaxID=387889 RepID=A0ABW6G0C5_9PSEU|nr:MULTISPECIES: AMP-binding protein [Prauserella salsuginis group]MCR3721263.1 bile acid-coenzyme A ligase [Prauserella flava]MCR3734657.1 bile acid-coenzyme A ligase [Prauserella salsuginis]